MNDIEPNQAALPRVTFVLLTYNQEEFVEAAIAGATQQTYPNLQIILSDDGSSDRTFELLCRARDTYEGPHQLLVNRTQQNRGTLRHLVEVAKLGDGEILVCAAGDDVSYPFRVDRLVAAWRRTGAAALFSKYDVIDEHGNLIEEDYVSDSRDLLFRDYFPYEITSIHGASSAYRRSTLAELNLPEEPVLFEDTYLTLLLSLWRHPIVFVDEALVQYRRHASSATNSDYSLHDPVLLRSRELAAEKTSNSVAHVLRAFEREVVRSGKEREIALHKVRSDLDFFDRRGRWSQTSILSRLLLLGKAERLEHKKWVIPRLFGLNMFIRLKRLQRSIQAR